LNAAATNAAIAYFAGPTTLPQGHEVFFLKTLHFEE
jgi:hypothetical protein